MARKYSIRCIKAFRLKLESGMDHRMPAPLPASLRGRFKQYIEEGLSARAAALRLRISPATGVRWAQRIRRGGEASVAVMGRPVGHGKLAPYADFFQELIAQDPDITLFELRDALADAHGEKVHHSGIALMLKRLGYTHKKSRWLQANAIERA